MSNKIPDKWLYLPVILLGLYFFIRLVDQSKLMTIFPLDYSSDMPSYIASLFFLAKCGFNNLCPYWYNGFVSFHTFSPGWQFFAYPIYMLSKDILVSTYISIIIIYALSFFFIFLLGKNERFSITKRIAFFLFFFTNAINVGNFFKLGRMPAFFGWCMFLGIATLIFYYKEKKLDKKFIFLIPIFAFAILSHPQEAVLIAILIIPLFIIKGFYEKVIILLTVVLGTILTSFWWIPFILNLSHGSMLKHAHQGDWLWATSGPFLPTSIAAFFISGTLFFVFYHYWLSKKKSRKELLFFSPILILNLLFFLRVTPFIPVLENISPDPYIIFFLFFTIYLFFKIDLKILNNRVRRLLPYLLIFIVILNLAISHFKTPYFIEHTFNEEDIKSMFPYVDDKFIMLNIFSPQVDYSDGSSISYSYYAYAPVFFNLTTAGGFYYHIASDEYNERYKQFSYLKEKWSCEAFKENALFFNITNFIAYEYMCKNLKSCGLKKIKENNYVCLYKIPN